MAFMISLPPKIEQLLQTRAQALGKPASDYAAELVEQAVARPTLGDILAPVHEEFDRSGMGERQLGDTLQSAIESSRRDRRKGEDQ